MISVYVNYPNPRITVHSNSECPEIQKSAKPSQRKSRITQATFTSEIQKLASPGFQLGSSAPVNDLWLSIDFDDDEFELATAHFVQRVFAKRYPYLDGALVKKHC